MEVDVGATAYVVDQPYLASLSEALTTDVGSQLDTPVTTQPVLAPDTGVSTTAFQTLATNLAHRQLAVNTNITTDKAHGHGNGNGNGNGNGPFSVTAPGIVDGGTTVDDALTAVINTQEVAVSSMTGTDHRTLTTEQNTTPGQARLTSLPAPSSTPSSSPNTSQTKAVARGASGASMIVTRAIAGGVSGVSLVVILGAIVFCILRRKRQYRAARSASSHEVPTSSDIPGQSLPQSAHLSTTPQPFLDFRLTQNQPSSKGIITGHASLLTRNNQVDIEQAADPFKDPVPATGSLSNNDDEVQRVRDTLDRLQALTSRFEREVQQLGVLSKSGQLSAEDRLRLEEIRRTTGLKIPWDSSPDRVSMARSSSCSSSSPPSYHTHGS